MTLHYYAMFCNIIFHLRKGIRLYVPEDIVT